MSAELTRISTIPVYKGLTPMQSYAKIVEADGIPITGPRGGKNPPLDGWANIGTWQNEQGDILTAPICATDDGWVVD